MLFLYFISDFIPLDSKSGSTDRNESGSGSTSLVIILLSLPTQLTQLFCTDTIISSVISSYQYHLLSVTTKKYIYMVTEEKKYGKLKEKMSFLHLITRINSKNLIKKKMNKDNISLFSTVWIIKKNVFYEFSWSLNSIADLALLRVELNLRGLGGRTGRTSSIKGLTEKVQELTSNLTSILDIFLFMNLK